MSKSTIPRTLPPKFIVKLIAMLQEIASSEENGNITLQEICNRFTEKYYTRDEPFKIAKTTVERYGKEVRGFKVRHAGIFQGTASQLEKLDRRVSELEATLALVKSSLSNDLQRRISESMNQWRRERDAKEAAK